MKLRRHYGLAKDVHHLETTDAVGRRGAGTERRRPEDGDVGSPSDSAIRDNAVPSAR